MAAYLHCDGCKRAFDVAAVPSCPHCGQRLGGEPEPDSLEDRVADAAARIASALARATVEERAALRVALGQRMLAAEAAAEGSTSELARWLPASLAAVQRAVVSVEERRLPPGDEARPAWLSAAVGIVARIARPLPPVWKRRARRVLAAFA
jgi:hypothetical protein